MLVSVVLPAYNAELYLKEAIDSILEQTFTDFELIVLNDGSSDSTEDIILSYTDSRIVYVKNQENLGLIGTLNKGISLAKGKYIARMDADDISVINRFEMQVRFLEENREYIICGTQANRFYNSVFESKAFNAPVNDESIRIKLLFNSGFIHPSVMFRASPVWENNLKFNDGYKYAEDYYFWLELLKYGKGYNLKEKLLYYRVVDNSQTAIGNSSFEKRKEVIGNIHRKYLQNLNIQLDDDEVDLLFYLSNVERIKLLDFDKFDLKFILNFFNKIRKELILSGYDVGVVEKVLGRFYFSYFYIHRNLFLERFIFLHKMDYKLLFFGAVEFLKDRIAK